MSNSYAVACSFRKRELVTRRGLLLQHFYVVLFSIPVFGVWCFFFLLLSKETHFFYFSKEDLLELTSWANSSLFSSKFLTHVFCISVFILLLLLLISQFQFPFAFNCLLEQDFEMWESCRSVKSRREAPLSFSWLWFRSPLWSQMALLVRGVKRYFQWRESEWNRVLVTKFRPAKEKLSSKSARSYNKKRSSSIVSSQFTNRFGNFLFFNSGTEKKAVNRSRRN